MRQSKSGGGSHHQITAAADTTAYTAAAAATTERRGGSRGGGELAQAETEMMTGCNFVRSGGGAAATPVPACGKGTLPPLLGLTISRWLDRRPLCLQRNKRLRNGGGVNVHGGWQRLQQRRR